MAARANKGVDMGHDDGFRGGCGCTGFLGQAWQRANAQKEEGGQGLSHPYKIKRKRPRLGAA